MHPIVNTFITAFLAWYLGGCSIIRMLHPWHCFLKANLAVGLKIWHFYVKPTSPSRPLFKKVCLNGTSSWKVTSQLFEKSSVDKRHLLVKNEKTIFQFTFPLISRGHCMHPSNATSGAHFS